MEENQDKNKGGRPNKLKNFIEAFKQVLEKNEEQVVYLTDDELRIVCNDLLDKEAQICDATFEKRKAGKIKDNLEYQEFLRLYKKGLVNQKTELFKKLRNDPNQWQRFAWIIERKFSDWNLKQLGEFKNDNTNLNIDTNIEQIEKMTSKQLEDLKQKLL